MPSRPILISGQLRGWSWGQGTENAIWLATRSRRRFMWRKHDALFIALGRFRLRLMKPRPAGYWQAAGTAQYSTLESA